MSLEERQDFIGIGVGRHAVVGPVVQVQIPEPMDLNLPVLRKGAEVTPQEVPGVIEDAFAQVTQDFSARAAQASGSLSEVLGATAQIAADPALLKGVKQELDKGSSGLAAVHMAIGSFIDMFMTAGGLMAERVPDLVSVRDRVLAIASGQPLPGMPQLGVPSVLIARDLTPADTSALDLDKVLAIVTEEGGPTGHTAIIAGQLGIPCVVRVPGATQIQEGALVLADAREGIVRVSPSEDDRQCVVERNAAEQILEQDSDPAATADGIPIDLLVNIGTVSDAVAAAAKQDAHKAAGTGLFRTEVLFLDAPQAPSVAEQEQAYSAVLQAFGTRKVVVRTLDAGADKPLAFASLPNEENPALGMRGYRTTRLHPQLLQDQLEALANASENTGAAPWVMAPMISTAAEARDFAEQARAAGVVQVGVMIEVPAAALRIREILREVDFVSIGTNDLAQYVMATDRLQGELADLLDKWQPAVLDLIALTAQSGAEAGKPVGVCGQSASDPLMAAVLVGMGVTSLSVSPSDVPAVRFILRQHTQAQLQRMASAALAAADAHEARDAVRSQLELQCQRLFT